jgi:hypothetical protein
LPWVMGATAAIASASVKSPAERVRPMAPGGSAMRILAGAYRFLHRYRANTPDAL